MKPKDLTTKQRDLLEFMLDHFDQNDAFPPSRFSAMMFKCEQNNITQMTMALTKKGWLERNEYKRGLKRTKGCIKIYYSGQLKYNKAVKNGKEN